MLTNGAFFWACSGIGIAGMIRIILPFRAWVDYRHVKTSYQCHYEGFIATRSGTSVARKRTIVFLIPTIPIFRIRPKRTHPKCARQLTWVTLNFTGFPLLFINDAYLLSKRVRRQVVVFLSRQRNNKDTCNKRYLIVKYLLFDLFYFWNRIVMFLKSSVCRKALKSSIHTRQSLIICASCERSN